MRLQPKLPRMRKRKGGEPSEEGKQESGKKPMQDKGLLIGIVVVIAAAVIVLVYFWLYPPAPAGPQNALSDSDVRAELERLQEISRDPERIDPMDYPKAIGVYWKNSLVLEEVYFCSDVCPDYGRVELVFRGVGPEECGRIGGKEIRDLAFGAYIGCGPKLG